MHTTTSKHKGLSFVLKYIFDHNGEALLMIFLKKCIFPLQEYQQLSNKLEKRGLVTRQTSQQMQKTMIA